MRPPDPAWVGVLAPPGRGPHADFAGSLDNLQMVGANSAAIRARVDDHGQPVSAIVDRLCGGFSDFRDPDGRGSALQQLPEWATGAGGSGENWDVVGG